MSVMRVMPIKQNVIDMNRQRVVALIAEQGAKSREYYTKLCNLKEHMDVEGDTMRPEIRLRNEAFLTHYADEIDLCYEYQHELSNVLTSIGQLEETIKK